MPDFRVGTVLVVDDEASIRELLLTVFQAEGFSVHAVADGESALLAISVSIPDVIVLDLGLPGISGADVLRQIRAGGIDVRVLVLSAALHGAAIAANAGADDYLAKPFDLDELLSRVACL